MKKIIKTICSMLICFSAFTCVNNLAKFYATKNEKDLLKEAFNDINVLLDDYAKADITTITEKNTNEKNIKKMNFKENENLNNLENLKTFDRLEIESRNFLNDNFEKTEYFGEKFKNGISKEEFNEFIDYSNASDPYEYAKNILINGDFDQSLIDYLDDLEFREFCLQQEIDCNGVSKVNNEVIIDIDAEKHLASMIQNLNNNDIGFIIDTGDGSSGNDENNNDLNEQDNFIMPAQNEAVRPNWEPSQTSSVEQLLVLLPEFAVVALLSSVVLVKSAGGSLTIPIIGPYASAVLIALAIVLIAIIAYYLIPVIEFIIGYFLNVIRGFVNLIQSFFASFISYTVSNALDIAIDSATENNEYKGLSADDIKNRLGFSIKQAGQAISILPKNLIVPLGVQDEMLRVVSRHSNYVYYNSENYVFDFNKYGYEGMWLINEVFIHYMVLNGAHFLLCSRPSLYYNDVTKELVEIRAYARELQLINTVYHYYWNEIPTMCPNFPQIDYVPSFAIKSLVY